MFSKDKDQMAATAVMLIAIVIMVASLVILLLPKQSTDAMVKDFSNRKAEALSSATSAKRNSEALALSVAKLTWPGPGSQIAPASLGIVTNFAAKHNVKLLHFQPQRAVDDGNLTQIPFTVSLDGAYTDVVAMEKDLDTPDSKLAVEQFNVTSADESSSHVTGTVSVEAYMVDSPSTADVTSSTTTVKSTQTKSGPGKPAPRVTAPTKSSSSAPIRSNHAGA